MRAYLVATLLALLFSGGISLALQPTASQISPPLSVSDIEHALKAGVTNTRMTALVKQYGVDFALTDAVEKELSAAGANGDLLFAVSHNKRVGSVAQTSPSEAPRDEGEISDNAVAKAEADAKAGRLRDAVLGAQDVLKHDPNNLRAHKLIGQIYFRSIGDIQTATVSQVLNLAIEQYEQIVKLEPSNVDGHILLGRLYRINNDLPRAESEFKAALRLSSGSEEAATALDLLHNEELHRPAQANSESVLSVIRENFAEPNVPLSADGNLREQLESVDVNSTYMNPAQYKDYKGHSAGAKGGIGAAILKSSGTATVISVIRGSPADKAGVQSFDTFVAIDGKNTRELSVLEIRNMLAGVPGSTVTISLLREGQSTPEKTIVGRELISMPPVTGDMVAYGIGHIHVEALPSGKTQEIAAKIKSLESEGAQKLILDLRNCADGEVSEGIATANLFLDHGAIAYLQGQKFSRMAFNADASKTLTSLPLVVLVNKGTFGPAEIVAAAIKENARGAVVGDTTSGGAGSIEKQINFPDSSVLILTVAKYYSPLGGAIYGGVIPNIKVWEQDQRLHTKQRDEQLEKAIAVLQTPTG
jgi:carboxyl-terminal processing protease